MIRVLALACLLALASGKCYLEEKFDDGWRERWVDSTWKKADGTQGKFTTSAGEYYNDAEKDIGLKTAEDAKFFATSTKFEKLDNKDKSLVIQFQTKNEQNIECGGQYVKVGPAIDDLAEFKESTEYNIMFGPDQCGSSTKKTHVIFNYKGKNMDRKSDMEMKTDNLSHLYTLIVKPDSTYEARIDGEKKVSGSMLDDWDYLKPKTIKDPEVSKPDDWVDEKEIEDADDKQPDDWVSEAKIADAEATKPEDWDDEEDGEWEPPMKDNPDFKGEWKAKKIDNPAYKGEWEHPMIDNPDFVEEKDVYHYPDTSMVGIDVWQVKGGTIFDNILICDDEADIEPHTAYFKEMAAAEKEKKEKVEEEKRKADEARRKEEEAKKEDEEDDDDDEDEDDDDKEEDDL